MKSIGMPSIAGGSAGAGAAVAVLVKTHNKTSQGRVARIEFSQLACVEVRIREGEPEPAGKPSPCRPALLNDADCNQRRRNDSKTPICCPQSSPAATAPRSRNAGAKQANSWARSLLFYRYENS